MQFFSFFRDVHADDGDAAGVEAGAGQGGDGPRRRHAGRAGGADDAGVAAAPRPRRPTGGQRQPPQPRRHQNVAQLRFRYRR